MTQKSIVRISLLLISTIIGCGGPAIEPSAPRTVSRTLVVREVMDVRPYSASRIWRHQATQTVANQVSRSGLFENIETQGAGDFILKSEVLSVETKRYGHSSSLALDGLGITTAIMGLTGALFSGDEVISQTSAAVVASGVAFAGLARLVGRPRTEKEVELKASLISTHTGHVLWQGRLRGMGSAEDNRRMAQIELEAIRVAAGQMVTALGDYLQTQDFERAQVVYANSPLPRSDVDTDIPHTDMRNPHAVAVVIGNREYRHRDIPHVDFAENDARVVKEHLTHTLGYQEGNIFFEPNATKAELETIFGTETTPQGKLHSAVSPGLSDVFVYYSGHGAPHPSSERAYLMPVDADASRIRINGYALDVLYRNLAAIPARRFVIVIDACFSGGSHRGALLKNISPLVIPKLRIDADLLERGVVFTSTASRQVSCWYPEKGHGLFTYFFLKGLRGEADENGDGQITSQELGGYLDNPNAGVRYYARQLYNREQTPEMHGRTDLVLVRFNHRPSNEEDYDASIRNWND